LEALLWAHPGLSFSAYCYIPFQAHLACIIQSKAFVTNEDNHMLITASIHNERLGRQMDGNMGSITMKRLIPVAAWSKVWFSGHWLAGIEGSNPAGYMDVCYLCVVR